MIPLRLPAQIEGDEPFVTRVRYRTTSGLVITGSDSVIVAEDGNGIVLCGDGGLVSVDGAPSADLIGDVVLVDPARGAVERLIRANSSHNTLLVTERCDQLCQMCSQPPKKTHHDRFAFLRQACLLAPDDITIGITGGEPTLYKNGLLELIEAVLAERPDLSFHVLSNGQHFDADDTVRLRDKRYQRVVWGIPVYSADAATHDRIVGKEGAFDRLHESFAVLAKARARIELRTVVLQDNACHLPAIARYVIYRLPFIETWSIMQLENIGFARRRWHELFYDHQQGFEPIAAALDLAALHAVSAALFNMPLCTLPERYRPFAVRSISDWKQRYVEPCQRCNRRAECAGFFEWHPEADALNWARPL